MTSRFQSNSSELLGQGRDRPRASLIPLIFSLLPRAEAGWLPGHRTLKTEQKPGHFPASEIIPSLTKTNLPCVLPCWYHTSATVFLSGGCGHVSMLGFCLPPLPSWPERIHTVSLRDMLALSLKGPSSCCMPLSRGRGSFYPPPKGGASATSSGDPHTGLLRYQRKLRAHRPSVPTLAPGNHETSSDPSTLPDPETSEEPDLG